MTLQPDLFSTAPVNTKPFDGQNLKLYNYLKEGGRIHWWHPKLREFGIGVLNSRISDLRNKYHIPVKDAPIKVQDATGQWRRIKEYFLDQSDIARFKQQFL